MGQQKNDSTKKISAQSFLMHSYKRRLAPSLAYPLVKIMASCMTLALLSSSANAAANVVTEQQASTVTGVTDPAGGISDAIGSFTSSLNINGPVAVGSDDSFRFNRLAFNATGPITKSRYPVDPIMMQHMSGRNSSRSVNNNDRVLQALAQNGPVTSEHREHRFWVAPYYTQGDSSNVGTKIHSKDRFEGAAFGLERRSKAGRWLVGITGSGGIGQQRLPGGGTTPKTKASSKTVSLGMYHSKEFLSHGRYDLNVGAFLTRFNTTRYGAPLPGTLYAARGQFNNRSLTGNILTSWLFLFDNGISVRPSIAFNGGLSTTQRFTEINAGIYNQSYGRKNSHSAEPYAGIGIRRKWSMGDGAYDCKITGIIEQGYELGTNSSTNNVGVASALAQQNFPITTRGPGRNATYFTLYGSVLNVGKKFKTLIGVTSTLKRYRTSSAIIARFEWRW